MANNLYFTIGLPRSGKSTLARQWQSGELVIINGLFTEVIGIDTGPPRVVVTPDHWRIALGHRYNWYAEPVIFSHVQIAIRALLQNYEVLVDDTHTTKESVMRIFEIDPNASPAFVPTGVSTCKLRAIQTGQPDLGPVIDRMAVNLYKNYGTKYEKRDEFLNAIRHEVVTHASRKIVI